MSTLRTIRKEKKLTLDDVSKATGFTKSYISQIERNLKSPSIDTLRKICAFLDISVSIPLTTSEETATDDDYVFLSHEKRTLAKHLVNDHDGYIHLEMLSPEQGKSGLRVVVVDVPPSLSVSGKQIRHAHSELAYVLEGTVEAMMGEEIIPMETYDSIYVNSMVLHDYINSSSKVAKVLFAFYD